MRVWVRVSSCKCARVVAAAAAAADGHARRRLLEEWRRAGVGVSSCECVSVVDAAVSDGIVCRCSMAGEWYGHRKDPSSDHNVWRIWAGEC